MTYFLLGICVGIVLVKASYGIKYWFDCKHSAK